MQDPKPIPIEQCTHHIFFSITGNVLNIAVDLKDRLSKFGYKSWIYTEVFDDTLMEKIFNGIKKSVIFMALVTPNYLVSEYCLKEIRIAGLLKKPIIPIVCENLDIWPPEEIIMQVMDTIYIPLFNNNNQWNDDLFTHLLSRLPSVDIIQVTNLNRSRSPSLSSSSNNASTVRNCSKSPTNKYLSLPDTRRSRSKSPRSSQNSLNTDNHKSRKLLERSPSTDVTLFHQIDNWPALTKTIDHNN